MSGAREGRAFQKPFRKPGRKPFGKPYGKPGGKRRGRPSERDDDFPPWKARRRANEDFPRRPYREERHDDGGQPADEEPSPHAGKFYERYAKRPKAPRPAPAEGCEERGETPRPGRWLQSSERPQRIPSSAGPRNYDDRRDDRPRRDDYRRRDDDFRGGPMRTNEGRERLGASSGFRRDFDSSGRRDDYQRRDDRRDEPRDAPRERPFDREQRGPRSQGYGPELSAGAYDTRRDESRRSDAPRPWQDGPREPQRRAPERGAPHLERRIIRSEGAKADQPFAPPPRDDPPAPLSAARDIAARVLLRRLQGSAFVEDLLDDAFATTKMRPDDRRLTQEMVYGCVRWQGTLDWLVARKTEDRPQIAQVQVFLRLGLYQLFFLDRIPPHAACFETVEIAKRLGFVNQANFINAILRRSEADRAEVQLALADLRESQPALGYSHPEWLVDKWTARWGADDTRRMLEWNNTAPLTHVRVNTLKTTPEALLERWRLKENVEYDFVTCPWADAGHVFALKTHPPLASMGSFRDGWFYVQDPSTLLAVQSLDAWAGENILDLCAAPGGKTAHIAQKMENDGELLACDSSPDRLRLVTENCARLGATCVKTQALGDHPEAALAQRKFDKVLVDAPCSNTGVLRRRLDLRWRVRSEELDRLRETQSALLRLAAAHLKPGGTLVYSTCSLEPEENADVVREFLAAQPQFKLESERDLLPFRDGVDGAYVAKLVG
jgi:16S rRNA (cytosine967-C5)-methyltransferase